MSIKPKVQWIKLLLPINSQYEGKDLQRVNEVHTRIKYAIIQVRSTQRLRDGNWMYVIDIFVL